MTVADMYTDYLEVSSYEKYLITLMFYTYWHKADE